jgi:hypothetical protein
MVRKHGWFIAASRARSDGWETVHIPVHHPPCRVVPPMVTVVAPFEGTNLVDHDDEYCSIRTHAGKHECCGN